jgi:hypothetical protein
MQYKQFLLESKEKQIMSFCKFCKGTILVWILCRKLFVINDPQFSIDNKTFGCFDLQNDIIKIQTANRHPLDVMRTLSHELVHFQQKKSGKGNEWRKPAQIAKNEANSVAGEIMRHFTKTISNHGY